MSKKLIVHPTAISQWQSTVTEACSARSITISQDIESYLVHLLEKNTSCPDLLSKIIGYDLLESIGLVNSSSSNKLKEVADNCLLISGLFPGAALRRRLDTSYYIQIGKLAYHNIANYRETAADTNIFLQLKENFNTLVDLLLAIRSLDQPSNNLLTLIAAHELWQQQGSRYALDHIQQMHPDRSIITSKTNTRH